MPDGQGPRLDINFVSLKKPTKNSVANDIRLTFVPLSGKYLGISYLWHFSVLRVFLYSKCFLH